MAEPFLGEIKIFPFDYAPRGWALCDGSLMSISQNTALYSLLGTIYGGNGTTTFALPDLRGRTPVHVGGGIAQGMAGGEERHALTVAEMPAHTHAAAASTVDAAVATPVGNLWSKMSGDGYSGTANTQMHTTAIGPAGGGQGHENMQPYLTLNFCIALVGIFPSRN